MIARALNALGLMRVSGHEEFVQVAGSALQNSEDDLKREQNVCRRMMNERNDIAAKHGAAVMKLNASEAKFKTAARDLAAQSDEIVELREAAHREGVRFNELASDRDNWRQECLDLRHDAQKWRDKLARDRAARKGVGK